MEPIRPPGAVGGQRHGREPFVLIWSRGVPRHVVDPAYGPVLVGEVHIDRAALVPTGSRIPLPACEGGLTPGGPGCQVRYADGPVLERHLGPLSDDLVRVRTVPPLVVAD